MDLDPDAFNEFLGNWAQTVQWRQSDICPCRDPNSNAPSPTCRVCTNGQIWAAAAATKLAISGQKVQTKWAQMGRYENGDVVCTLASDQAIYAMREFDRVLFTKSTEPFSRNLVNTGTPKLPFAVVQVDRLFWLNDALTQVVDGTIPTVGADGTITFGVNAPPAGAQFTISGRRNPEYYCYMELTQDRAHFDGAALPRRVVLRKFDLFGMAV
jgi:hypothetical protein